MKRIAGAVVVSALGIGACASAPPSPLVVAAVRQPATSLFFVAQGAGCFAREGLAVEARSFELGRDALGLLRQGGAEAAIAYETPVLRAARADPSLRALTILHSSSRNTRLIARRGGGVRSLGDLAGKRVGVARGTNADFFIDLALRFGRVARDDVRVRDLPPEESVQALAAGDLDAAAVSDPHAAEAERRLGAEAVVLRTELYAEFSMLVARADTVAARRAALEALLRGLACGERLAQADPARAVALIRPRFPELSEEGLRRQVDAVAWRLGLDHQLLDVLRRERAWLAGEGDDGEAASEVERLIEPGPLEAVDPEAVTLAPSPRGAS